MSRPQLERIRDVRSMVRTAPEMEGAKLMKILEKGTMPNGTEIQLEDWSEHNTPEYPELYGLMIGAYPFAKNTSKYRWIESGKLFRLSISKNTYTGYTNEQVKEDYIALRSGSKSLTDLAPHFRDGERDMWYLGMNVQSANY